MVCIRYNPDELDPHAYVGLINDFAFYTTYESELVIIGFVDMTISGSVYTVDGIKEEDSTSGLSRENYDLIDHSS